MFIVNIISFILVLIGALNWGLVGIFDFNVVDAIFGGGRNLGSSIIYVLVLIAAIWLIISCVMERGQINFRRNDITKK